MTFPFFELFTADGRRERGARTELALRTRADREFDVGDPGREEGRDRGDVVFTETAVEVVVTSSEVAARRGEGIDVTASSREFVGESDLGEATNVSSFRSCASPINRLTCSTATSRFFVS
jgi:hypothetical protein